jgi:superoxide dismutase, Cu-Zn family
MGYGRLLRLGGVALAASAVAVVTLSSPGQADPAVASATLHDISGQEVGEVRFTPNGHGSLKGHLEVTIAHDASINPTDFNGVHLHANDTGATNGCVVYDGATPPPTDKALWFTEVDGHWNPGGNNHGHHVGDLPSVVRESDGEASLTFTVDKFAAGDLPGRAVVVHLNADDFGKGGGTSLTNGNAGPRFACGVVVPSGNGK